MMTLLLLLPALAADPYADQQLCRHVYDSRRDAIQYRSDLVGDTVVTTPEMITVGDYYWEVQQGQTRISAREFATLTGDDKALRAMAKEERQNRRLGWLVAGAGAVMGATLGAVYLTEGDERAYYVLVPGTVLGLGLGLSSVQAARRVGEEYDGVYTDKQIDAAIARYNEALAAKLSVDAGTVSEHPALVLHKSN